MIEALSLSKDQQAKLDAIFAENSGRKDEMVYSVNINTIFVRVTADRMLPRERQALAEQHRRKDRR